MTSRLISSEKLSIKTLSAEEQRAWNDAVDAVLELLRIHPPHRIGEAAFMRRLVSLKQKGKPNAK